MPATPAWPPRSTPRLFVDEELGEGQRRIEGPAAHYLLSVMRLKTGDPVKLFDDRTGEWLAVVAGAGKRDLMVNVTGRLREREVAPDLWLCAAPLKKGRVDWVAEKACELGVNAFVPVVTRRTVVDRVNIGRLRAHMIEAAEQCDRTAIPQMAEPIALSTLMMGFGRDRALFFADESGGMPALDAMRENPGPGAILIGPEGGFDPDERDLIRFHERAVPISLGPRILRADTAAAAAVAVWMSVAGDW